MAMNPETCVATNGPTRATKSAEVWITILVVIVTWIFAGGMTYGFFQAKNEETIRRIDLLERAQTENVSRHEYDTRLDEMNRRLERIESKLDRLAERRSTSH